MIDNFFSIGWQTDKARQPDARLGKAWQVPIRQPDARQRSSADQAVRNMSATTKMCVSRGVGGANHKP